MSIKTALAGALMLNLPTVPAAFYLSGSTVAVMAVSLALLGAVLASLAAWGLSEPRAADEAGTAAGAQAEFAQAA
jgi:hypothetical protein